MNSTPTIGIPCTILVQAQTAKPYCAVKRTYLTAVSAAGGIPLPIPCGLADSQVQALYRQCAGILFAGGSDIDPRLYGQDNSSGLSKEITPERDALELQLARMCIADHKPFLGICRGAQLLNVALGGTLIQDLPDRLGNTVNHQPGLGDSEFAHTISIEPDTRLSAILGKRNCQVNSRHHQCLDRLGAGLVVSARSDRDQVVEAIECIGWFCLAVQWHPEDLCAVEALWGDLFKSLIEACSQR